MFTKISIDYPEFGLKIERDFVPGINLIEEPNGYGKTTVINTLLSVFSKKYPGLRTLPSGTAKVHTQDTAYMLSKGVWVGLEEEPNDLVRYVLPGEFFALSSPQQRSTMVRLLGIDHEGFMKSKVPTWDKDLKKTVSARMKENAGKESVIIDDITRLTSRVLAFEKDPVTYEDNSQEIERAYSVTVRSHNENRLRIQEENFAKVRKNQSVDQKIAMLKDEQERLRANFMKLSEGKCPTCGGDIDNGNALVDINKRGKEITSEIKALELQRVDATPQELPEPLPEISLVEKAKAVGFELKLSTPETREKIAAYEADKKELALKENMLRSLGELDDKKLMASIDAASKEFTKILETKVKETGLEIELFKEQKNGDIVESFSIMKDGKEYSELSGGNRLMVQLRVSLAFAKLLGLDFVLIDEAGLISQDNFEAIRKECEGFQVIMARATPFKLQPPK